MSTKIKPLEYLIKDPLIWVMICCAGLFWFALSFYFSITSNLLWPLNTPLAFIIPVLLYPILEEIVFRGAVMDFLHEKMPGDLFIHLTKANFISSILFTSLHFIYHPPIWATVVFIPSLIFGILKERYQNLLPPILLHVFFNAGYYWLFTK